MISLKDVCRCFASMDAGKIQLMGIAPVPTVQAVQPLRSVQNVKTNTSRRGTSTFREFSKRRISTLKRNRVEFFGFCLMPNHFQGCRSRSPNCIESSIGYGRTTRLALTVRFGLIFSKAVHHTARNNRQPRVRLACWDRHRSRFSCGSDYHRLVLSRGCGRELRCIPRTRRII